MTSEIKISRGMRDVHFDRTRSSYIDGRNGVLLYRGYNIHALAERSNYEETAYLLLFGELPTSAQLAEFDASLKAARRIPPKITGIIETIKSGHPMDVLRTAVSALSAFDAESDDNALDATRRKGIRLCSQVPTIVMTHHALREGREPVPPSDTLSHAANFLYMFTGEEPGDDAAALFDRDFVLHADHGSNASSFTARVVTGTTAGIHGAIAAAIAALAGPLHGGAAEGVMKMALEIGEPANAAAYVKREQAERRPIMGFGHAVYKSEDPRARHLREGVRQLAEAMGDPKWYSILEAVVEVMSPYARRGIHPNVDFYAGVIYYLVGFPEDMFVPIFAIGRMPGWTLQILEQWENNILLRPRLVYTGPDEREYVPIDQR